MKANKTIRWKVILNKSRKSNVIIGDYCLLYIKNKITKAPNGTLGIFCFTTKKYAKQWALEQSNWVKIIKVITYGKSKIPQRIADSTSTDGLIQWYKNYKKSTCTYIQPGTICYPAVMPLE
jgi:hypothetical protein